MQLSEAGAAMLGALEGERGAMYRDQCGLPTIGVGHRLTLSELHSGQIVLGHVVLPWREGLSPLAIEALLAHDTATAAAAITQLVTTPLTQPQFDALVSFAFNVGVEAFRTSTLLRAVNAGHYADVPALLREWIKGHLPDGSLVVLPALVARRETEIARWEAAA